MLTSFLVRNSVFVYVTIVSVIHKLYICQKIDFLDKKS